MKCLESSFLMVKNHIKISISESSRVFPVDPQSRWALQNQGTEKGVVVSRAWRRKRSIAATKGMLNQQTCVFSVA
jgi:hypothetical protein